ncbi:zinc ribbon domain-containing protein [Roseateles chitinivorans]|uniref:zinc ribbon domain-containing protein n=2 Tax=Roseateles chitinivorans TaxID=2917965 RepID=UPI000B4C563A|nr:hypothetical protein CDL60_06020 [Roseateles noduli]RZI62505.1 MAG: zinc ribbon domain-containing protein [Rubrivivax sp.]
MATHWAAPWLPARQPRCIGATMSILRRLFSGHHSGGHGRSDHHGGHRRLGDPRYDSHGSRNSGWSEPSQPPMERSNEQHVACMRCGASNNAAGRFCTQCGFALRPTACGKCAEPLGTEGKFCPNCGTPIPAASPASSG